MSHHYSASRFWVSSWRCPPGFHRSYAFPGWVFRDSGDLAGRCHDRLSCCGVCGRGALGLDYALAKESVIQISWIILSRPPDLGRINRRGNSHPRREAE